MHGSQDWARGHGAGHTCHRWPRDNSTPNDLIHAAHCPAPVPRVEQQEIGHLGGEALGAVLRGGGCSGCGGCQHRVAARQVLLLHARVRGVGRARAAVGGARVAQVHEGAARGAQEAAVCVGGVGAGRVLQGARKRKGHVKKGPCEEKAMQ